MSTHSLPIDPSAIDDEDIGAHYTELEMEHEPAVEHVKETFKAAGFGVATEFSPSTLLAEKIGAEREPYCVIGACNPHMADRALDASENRIGALFPCNVVVWEESPGVQAVYHVSIMRIAHLVGIAPQTEEWATIVEETSELVADAWENLTS